MGGLRGVRGLGNRIAVVAVGSCLLTLLGSRLLWGPDIDSGDAKQKALVKVERELLTEKKLRLVAERELNTCKERQQDENHPSKHHQKKKKKNKGKRTLRPAQYNEDDDWKEAVEDGQEDVEEEVDDPKHGAAKPDTSPLPYLSIAIPTVPRAGGKRYLASALASIEAQVTGLWRNNLRVHVMNMHPGQHPLFSEMKRKYREQRWAVFWEAQVTERLEDDPTKPAPSVHPARHQERPSEKVRRQTLDVALLLSKVAGTSSYTLLYEDDFELCNNGLLALQYMIEKANANIPDWAGIRCSFGLAGIVLHNAPPHTDLLSFSKYLKRHYARRPPDHLVVEWYAGEIDESKAYFGSRRVAAFRYNILHHIGQQSTLRAAKPWAFPGCFTELVSPQVFPVEAWNPNDCPEDDLWPCDSSSSPPSKLRWTTDPKDSVH